MAVVTNGIDYGSGGIAIRAAALVAADGNDAAVFTGRGWFLARIVWTACEIATGDEFYGVQFQANTAAVTGTYVDLCNIAFGNAALLGGAAATAATGEMWIAVWNPLDHQVRTANWVTGTIATGFNYSVDFYPVNVIGAY